MNIAPCVLKIGNCPSASTNGAELISIRTILKPPGSLMLSNKVGSIMVRAISCRIAKSAAHSMCDPAKQQGRQCEDRHNRRRDEAGVNDAILRLRAPGGFRVGDARTNQFAKVLLRPVSRCGRRNKTGVLSNRASGCIRVMRARPADNLGAIRIAARIRDSRESIAIRRGLPQPVAEFQMNPTRRRKPLSFSRCRCRCTRADVYRPFAS